MKARHLLAVLDEQDRGERVWLYTPAVLRILFPQESDNSLKMSLRRHVRAGLLKKSEKRLVCQRAGSLCPARQVAGSRALSQARPDQLCIERKPLE